MDVGADFALDFHGLFGADKIAQTSEGVSKIYATVRDEGEAVFFLGVFDVAFHGDDLAESASERHDLETARVGQGGTMPARVGGEAAVFRDKVCVGAEMITVGEHGFCSGGVERVHIEETNGASSADRHERRGVDVAVGGMDNAGATETVRNGF